MIRIVLILVGLLHVVPAVGMLGAKPLQHLYGVSIQDPTLLILMQHRAVMFGLIGSFLLVAAARSALQGMAIVAGMISTVSFVLIALATGGYDEAILRVVVADAVAISGLLLAAVFLCIGARAGLEPG